MTDSVRVRSNSSGALEFAEFRALNRRFPTLLFPLFRLQDSARRKTLGEQRCVSCPQAGGVTAVSLAGWRRWRAILRHSLASQGVIECPSRPSLLRRLALLFVCGAQQAVGSVYAAQGDGSGASQGVLSARSSHMADIAEVGETEGEGEAKPDQ